MRLLLADATLDLDTGTFVRADVSAQLSPTECRLLRHLAGAAGPVDEDELLEQVWGYAPGVQTRTVKTTVSRVRGKIERDPRNPEHLLTRPGEGYALVADVQAPQVERTGLPAELDRFVGRGEELDRLEAAFSAGRRVVTLLGPGGIGKTRLAQAFAGRSARPAVFVDLSGAETAAQLAITVAGALGATAAGDAVQVAGTALRGRGEVLVVLDNLEQIPDPEAALDRWAADAPAAWLLLTSRAATGTAGEAILELGPLPLDDAVTLLHERCSAARLDAAPDPEAPWLRALATGVEGYPLSLELLAAWTGMLPPEDLLDHVKPGAPLDGTWSRLGPEVQQALVRATAFRGGFDLEAAEAVLGDHALARLRALRQHALLRLEGRRYRMLAVVRQDAEGCDPAGAADARDRHLRHYLAGAERAARQLLTPERDDALAWFERERANWTAAHAHAVATDRAAAAALTLALEPWMSGSLGWLALVQAAADDEAPWEVRLAYAAALREAGAVDDAAARVRALHDEATDAQRALAGWQLGHLELVYGDRDAGIACLEDAKAHTDDARLLGWIGADLAGATRRTSTLHDTRAAYAAVLDQARRSGDRRLLAMALTGAAASERELPGGEPDRGVALLLEAEALLQAEGADRHLSLLYESLSAIHRTRGDADGARDAMTRALHHARRSGSLNRELATRWWWNLGYELNLGHTDVARAELTEILALARGSTSPAFVAMVTVNLGQVASDRGEHAEARRRYDEALAQGDRLDEAHRAVLWLVAGTGAAAAGDFERTRELLGQLFAVPRLRERRGNRVCVPFLALAGDPDAREALKTFVPNTDEDRAVLDWIRGRPTPFAERMADENWGARMARCCAQAGHTAP